jgi:hypothetical protein
MPVPTSLPFALELQDVTMAPLIRIRRANARLHLAEERLELLLKSRQVLVTDTLEEE